MSVLPTVRLASNSLASFGRATYPFPIDLKSINTSHYNITRSLPPSRDSSQWGGRYCHRGSEQVGQNVSATVSPLHLHASFHWPYITEMFLCQDYVLDYLYIFPRVPLVS